MKQIFLDTETTGLETKEGHRIIEVVAVAYENRVPVDGGGFHQYCNPERPIDPAAQKVHGITMDFLTEKPLFGEVAVLLQDYLRGGEIIIHNAAFDCDFLNTEFARCKLPPVEDVAGKITCTLEMSRVKNPRLGRHSLSALCRHYGVDDSARTVHSAMLDTRLLSQVYFAMTYEQMPMDMSYAGVARALPTETAAVRVHQASDEEVAAHEALLNGMEKDTGVMPIWRRQ